MEDVLTEQPPPSRFFLEDLNNFAPPSPPLPSPFLLLSNPNPNPNLLIISISPPSLSLLHHISPKTLIGTLILPEIPLSGNPLLPSPRHRSFNLFSLPASPSTLLAAVQYPVSGERSHAVAKTLLDELRPERVVVFDSIQRLNFRGRLSTDEAVAFKIETSRQRSEGSVLKGVDYFPSGSVIDGLAAAILARCQVKKIKGTLCVSWPDSGNSVVSLLKSLVKEVLPDLDLKGSVGSDWVRDGRVDSELYT
eukprot:TRINITY_DN4891_c0_g1_i1.p1 TRINITY_DN4891_c0_g1~~TRINITY_DN4891_c0_g1_i1.p1  ORF type:complete len:269 (-),score=53.13 TRINITY_DN4891_c0_g1_i1:120-869(-)